MGPGHELDEVLVQRDARLDVEDRRELVADEVRAHNLGIFRHKPKQVSTFHIHICYD